MLVLYNNILLETDDILVFLDVLSLSRILLFRFTCMNFHIILQEGLKLTDGTRTFKLHSWQSSHEPPLRWIDKQLRHSTGQAGRLIYHAHSTSRWSCLLVTSESRGWADFFFKRFVMADPTHTCWYNMGRKIATLTLLWAIIIPSVDLYIFFSPVEYRFLHFFKCFCI